MTQRKKRSLGLASGGGLSGQLHSIIPLDKKCVVCLKEMISLTCRTKESRERRRYCSRACKRIGSRLKFSKFAYGLRKEKIS